MMLLSNVHLETAVRAFFLCYMEWACKQAAGYNMRIHHYMCLLLVIIIIIIIVTTILTTILTRRISLLKEKEKKAQME